LLPTVLVLSTFLLAATVAVATVTVSTNEMMKKEQRQ